MTDHTCLAEAGGLMRSIYPASDKAALIDAHSNQSLSYRELHAEVAGMRELLLIAQEDAIGTEEQPETGSRSLAFLLTGNDLNSIIALLALQSAGFAVVLVDIAVGRSTLDTLLSAYSPLFVVAPDRDMLEGATQLSSTRQVFLSRPYCQQGLPRVNSAMCLGLTTSGSTGSPKLVRLAETAVAANASSIASALNIGNEDRAITCLPLHYAYGLSLLTSHLTAGASLVVSNAGFMDAAFWKQVKQWNVTSLAGVPYMYEMLHRLGPGRVIPPCVTVMTQAGGRLRDDLVEQMHAFMTQRGGRFHVMYGQTEATARIAIMPHDWLPARLGSAGKVIPGGRLEVRPVNGSESDAPLPPGSEGELYYTGPNVMLGYATERGDLARGDELAGVLRTGDIGRIDADGCLSITGRLKRIGKLYGVRVDLDELERQISFHAPAAVLEGDDQIVVFAALSAAQQELNAIEALVGQIAARLRVQQRNILIKPVPSLPRTSSGKIDYPALRSAV